MKNKKKITQLIKTKKLKMETQLTCKENATKVKHDCSQNVCKKGICDYFPTPPSERAKHMISGGILLLQRSGPSTTCRVFN